MNAIKTWTDLSAASDSDIMAWARSQPFRAQRNLNYYLQRSFTIPLNPNGQSSRKQLAESGRPNTLNTEPESHGEH